jgi:hypothetical protein
MEMGAQVQDLLLLKPLVVLEGKQLQQPRGDAGTQHKGFHRLPASDHRWQVLWFGEFETLVGSDTKSGDLLRQSSAMCRRHPHHPKSCESGFLNTWVLFSKKADSISLSAVLCFTAISTSSPSALN